MKTDDSARGWHTRGYLPHFDGGEITQFVTFRLNDSLPHSVLAKWKDELARGELADHDLRRRVEMYLDQNHGSCVLRDERIGGIVEENLLKFNRVAYKLHAWVVMPNHVHMLLTPNVKHELSKILHSCKSYTATAANKVLQQTGRFWFPESFDRFIRNRQHFDNAFNYIETNPVKANLCAKPADWRFSSAHPGSAGSLPA